MGESLPEKKEKPDDITQDLVERLSTAAGYMAGKAAIYKDTKLHVATILACVTSPQSNQAYTETAALRKILHVTKLPHLSEDDIRKLPNDVLCELGYNFPVFKELFENTRKTGHWDLKTSAYKKYQKTGVLIAGGHYEHDVTGNLLWGYAGAAGGISMETLTTMAGLGQKQMGTSAPEWTWEKSHFDDPRDQAAIMAGWYLFSKYKLQIDGPKIKEAFKKYGVPEIGP